MTIPYRDDMLPEYMKQGIASSVGKHSALDLASEPLPSAWDMAKQTWSDTLLVQNQNAHARKLNDVFDEVNDRVKQATGKDVFNPMVSEAVPLMPVKYSGAVPPSQTGDTMEMWRKIITDLKATHPDALPWDDILTEPERRSYAERKAIREHTDKISEQLGMIQGREIPYLRNIPMAGEIGALVANFTTAPGPSLAQFGAGMAGSFASTPDAALNLLGFGVGGVTKSLLNNAVRNAAVNAVGQMPLSAMKMADYEKAGLPHGFNVWLSEVEGAASSGFAIDAMIRGPVRAFRKATGATDNFGGAFLDAVPQQSPRVPQSPKLDIAPETFKAAEAGDLAATREILEKTGALDDPEIRGLLDHAETYGKLDAEMIKRLDDMGVARADGMRIVDGLLQGRYVRGADLEADVARMSSRPDPEIPSADAARVLAVTRPALDAIDPRLTDLAVHALESRVPEIEMLARTALARLDEKDSNPGEVARAFADGMREAMDSDAGPRIAAQARIASGMASSVEIANLVRSTTQIKSSLNPEISRHAEALALATLDDASLARVAAGDIPPSIAAHIADHVPPERQAQAIDDVARARPESMEEAVALIDEMVPLEPREAMPLDRSGGLDDPIGAEAKARVEAMKQEAAEAVKVAQEPIKERDKLDSKVETLKGEIAKLEEKAQPAYRDPETGDNLSAGDVASIIDMWQFVDEMRRKPEPERLGSFLRRNGGVQDVGTDVRHLIGGAKSRPGLVSSKGMDLDAAARMAWDAGYLQGAERPDVNALLDAIADDINGNPVLRLADEGVAEDIRIARDMERELYELGISQYRNAEDIRRHFAKPARQSAEGASRGQETDRGAQGEGIEVKDDVMFAISDGKDKAEKAGFDTSRVWYHGTNRAFEAFDPRAVLDERAKRDPYYAQSPRMVFLSSEAVLPTLWASGDGGRIMPNYIKRDLKLFDGARDADRLSAFISENEAAIRERLFNQAGTKDLAAAVRGGDWEILETPPVQKWLRDNGFDGFKAKSGRAEIAALFDTANDRGAIRSTNAAYDPAKANSANLMYALSEEKAGDKMFALSDDSLESTKARAQRMGFDTTKVFYHGTMESFDAFRVDDSDINEISGTYLATSRLETNMYAGAGLNERGVGQQGGRVLPLYIRSSNPAKLDVNTNKPIDKAQSARLEEIADNITEGGNAATEALRNAGFDSVEYHQNGKHIWTVVFDPSDIRSVNARFDPSGFDNPNLMFSLSDKDATTYAKKRGELHTSETALAEVQARLNPDPESAQALYRVAMRAVAQRRSDDVYRAVAHAVALGRKIAPEGTKIDVRSTELRDDATGNLLDAYYQKGESTIVLASYAADPAARMSHEVVHALVDHGLLTQNDVRMLAREAMKTDGVFNRDRAQQYARAYRGRDNIGALMTEEAAAHLIDARMKGKAKAPKNTVEGRVAQFVQRLRNLMKGYGFKTADDVAAAILNGEAARRSGSARPDGGRMMAMADRQTGQEMRRDLDALGYYSKLDEVLGGLGQKDKVTAQTLQAKGVKLAEIEARGLKDQLADGAAVPVSDLLEIAGRNRVGLNERVYDRSPPNERELANLRRNTGSEDDILARELGLGDDPSVPLDRTKWSSYSLDPSNPTYRETVLHLPRNAERMRAERQPLMDEFKALQDNDGRTSAETARMEELRAVLQDYTKRMNETDAQNFTSGHFPEPNIIGHMMTSMTTHEGRPVYTIDQIQSDWGQKLRDGGVRDEGKIAELEKQYLEANAKSLAMEADRLPTLTSNGAEALTKKKFGETATWAGLSDEQRHEVAKLSAENTAKNTELNRRMDAAGAESDRLEAEWNTARNSAVGHPLVNTTDQWLNTTLRRALRQAAEADAEYIAIPSGDTVLSYNPGDMNGMVQFYGRTQGRQSFDIGPDLEPVAKGESRAPVEGIVPKNLRKLLTKIDPSIKPAKADKLETPSGMKGSGFTLFPLTDKVKQSVKTEGQAMFAIRDTGEPRPILETEYAAIDRMNSFKDLIEACR